MCFSVHVCLWLHVSVCLSLNAPLCLCASVCWCLSVSVCASLCLWVSLSLPPHHTHSLFPYLSLSLSCVLAVVHFKYNNEYCILLLNRNCSAYKIFFFLITKMVLLCWWKLYCSVNYKLYCSTFGKLYWYSNCKLYCSGSKKLLFFLLSTNNIVLLI